MLYKQSELYYAFNKTLQTPLFSSDSVSRLQSP